MMAMRLVMAWVMTLVAATVVSAQPRVPGITDSEIVIGMTGPMSGPAATYGNLLLAQETWTRYVNDQGGVHGRKLKVVIKDDAFNPGRAVANVKELKDSSFLVVGMVGSAVINATKDELAEAKLPLVVAYANEGMESMKNFTVLGLSGPTTFGPNQHHGLNAVRLMRGVKAADQSVTQVTDYQVFKPLF